MNEEQPPDVEIDFDAEMRALGEEASRRPVAASQSDGSESKPLASLIRPLALQLESLARGSAEHARLLEKILGFERIFEQQNRLLEGLVNRIAKLEEAESRAVGQTMFDALHDELNHCKDDYLFDNHQRPLLMELISAYDTTAELETQTRTLREHFVSKVSSDEMDASGLSHIPENLGNLSAHLLEVLSRHDVEKAPPTEPRLDKRLQRVVRVIPTSDPGEDQLIVEELRPGFVRRDRVLRPANVVIKKHEASP